MREFCILYCPILGQFTKLTVRIRASSREAALSKFWARYDDNCDEILEIEAA